MTIDWPTVLAQLGASGIFMIGLVVVTEKFYQHYEGEIAYMRAKIDELEKEIIGLKNAIK